MWKVPPRIKVYEALGAIADGRVTVTGNTATVVSSNRNKEYTVEYQPEHNAISSNDNGSYWQGYVGYPAIAFLMLKGVLEYNRKTSELLQGIQWKDVNTKFKDDYTKTESYIQELIHNQDDWTLIQKTVADILEQIQKLRLKKISSNRKPPNE